KGVSISEFRKHSKKYQIDILSIEKRLDSIEEERGVEKVSLNQTLLDKETKKVLEHIKVIKNSIKD
ncbi:MAG: hypothetical protein ACOCP1_03615, partial [Campylobacterales bacterium]